MDTDTPVDTAIRVVVAEVGTRVPAEDTPAAVATLGTTFQAVDVVTVADAAMGAAEAITAVAAMGAAEAITADEGITAAAVSASAFTARLMPMDPVTTTPAIAPVTMIAGAIGILIPPARLTRATNTLFGPPATQNSGGLVDEPR